MGDLIKIILKDLKVELLDKFDSNFSRGAFFGKRWKPRPIASSLSVNVSLVTKSTLCSLFAVNFYKFLYFH